MTKGGQESSAADSDWRPDRASRCQRFAPSFDPERGWAKPNGTIGCDIPEHDVNKPSPEGLSYDEAVCWNVDHAPPLSPEQEEKLRVLFEPTVRGTGESGANHHARL